MRILATMASFLISVSYKAILMTIGIASKLGQSKHEAGETSPVLGTEVSKSNSKPAVGDRPPLFNLRESRHSDGK